MDAGERIVVEIDGGRAKRHNPNWSPEPQEARLRPRPRARARTRLKWAQVAGAAPVGVDGAETIAPSKILVEDKKGWRHSAGFWSMSVKAWQKGRFGSIFDALEALMNAKAELFEHDRADERQNGFVPR